MSRFPARKAYQRAEVADVYDEQRSATLMRRALQALEWRALEKVARTMPADFCVLDLPCGTGRLLPVLLNRFAHVTGADLSEAMLAVARERYADAANVEFVRADAEALPFEDGQFDCVFSVRFFGHAPPEVRVKVLGQMARVTRDRVALMLYVRDPVISLRKRLQHIVRPPRSPWYPVGSRAELRQTFEKAGLQVVKIRSLMPLVMESRLVVARRLGGRGEGA